MGRAIYINALKGKTNRTEHVLRVQQKVGKDESRERSRTQIRKGLVRLVKEFGLDLEGNR